MKFKYFLTSLVALAALFTGCTKQIIGGDLENLSVSSSYVSIPEKGGSATIEVDAKEAWSIVLPEKSEWLSVSPMSGAAGKTTITFSAKEGVNTQEAVIKIQVGSKYQYVNVKQQVGSGEAKMMTVKEVSEAPDGKIVMVEGVCTSIVESVKYGNWYLKDDTGEIYVYGTKYNGQTQQAALEKLGVEVGDILCVKGEKKLYSGTTLELVDVDVISITKSLIKVDPSEIKFDKEGNPQTVDVTLKCNDLDIKKPDWISIKNYTVVKGVTKVEFVAEANTGDVRTGEIVFTATSGKQVSAITVAVSQASGLAAYSLPFEETFSVGQGAFEVNNITLPEGKETIWSFAAGYGMKATSGSKVKGESELVSPNIDLNTAKNPVLTFEHVSRYAGNVDDELKLFVTKDNGATWDQVLIPVYSSGANWDFVKSGNISLAKFVGNLVMFKFVYKSTESAYATWEIKNLKVEDKEDMAITNIAELNDFATATEGAFSADFENEVTVSYVNGSNVFLEDATGGIQLYLKDHGLNAGDTIKGKVTGKIKLYNSYPELTALDLSAATKGTGTAPCTEMTLEKLLGSYLRYINRAVKIKDISFKKAITKEDRNGVITDGTLELNAYAQVKNTLEFATDVKGKLFCIPTRYNATLQVGVWEIAHFTPAE